MSQNRLLIVIATLLIAGSAHAQKINWSHLTKQQLCIMHDRLQSDSIVPYVKKLPSQVVWLEKGFIQALKQAETVPDRINYQRVLQFYVKGFNQSHLYLYHEKRKKIQNAHTSTSMREHNGVVWVKLPTFEPQSIEKKSLNEIIKRIAKYRHSKAIVFDVRNNPGGDSKYYRQLLFKLYTKPFLRSLGKNFLWNQEWTKRYRLSNDNVKAAKHFPIYDTLHSAQLQGKKTYQEHWYILNPDGPVSLKNPVSARVFILTNNRSYSSAWLFTRIVKQLPGAKQIGQETAICGYYSEPKSIHLYDNMIFNYPMNAVIAPDNDFGHRLQPDLIFKGDINNSHAINAWIEKLIFYLGSGQ
jgi:hypothetical protein